MSEISTLLVLNSSKANKASASPNKVDQWHLLVLQFQLRRPTPNRQDSSQTSVTMEVQTGQGEPQCQDPPGTPKASREFTEHSFYMGACNTG